MNIDKDDINKFEYLSKITTANDKDLNLIFSLYRKYINNNIKSFNKNCGCNNDIYKLYNSLIELYSKNKKHI